MGNGSGLHRRFVVANRTIDSRQHFCIQLNDRNDGFESRLHETQYAINQIGDIGNQDSVDGLLQLLPREVHITTFWPIVEQIEPPQLAVHYSQSIVTVQTNAPALGETLSPNPIQVFSGRDLIGQMVALL